MQPDEIDATVPTAIMGITNVVTAYLPAKWSRLFPLIPVLLGFAYAIIRGEGLARAITGAVAIAQYSILRNAAGTKPNDAPVKK